MAESILKFTGWFQADTESNSDWDVTDITLKFFEGSGNFEGRDSGRFATFNFRGQRMPNGNLLATVYDSQDLPMAFFIMTRTTDGYEGRTLFQRGAGKPPMTGIYRWKHNFSQ